MSTTTPVLGSIGDRVDLRIRQGATFGPHELTLTNPDASAVDLTGCTLRGQVRRMALATTVLAELVCAITVPLQGKATFTISAATTGAIPAGEDSRDPLSSAVWDLELLDAAGRVTPIFYGAVLVFREVTRA